MIELLTSTLRFAAPLTFAASGGVLSERSGVYNIALEGAILGGAFGAAAGATFTGHAIGGIAAGLFMGLLMGLLLAILTVILGVNQFVAGIAVNLLTVGLTAFVARLISLDGGRTVPGFAAIGPQSWQKVPILGSLVFAQDPLTLTVYLFPFGLSYLLNYTRWGLQLQAVGENPWAADVAGIRVRQLRFIAVAASCMLASLGGCLLVLTQVFVFSENMSAGKGFIALAAVILGRWSFLGAAFACLVFGFCEAMSLYLQFHYSWLPYQLFTMLPYAAALIALLFVGDHSGAPRGVGTFYNRAL